VIRNYKRKSDLGSLIYVSDISLKERLISPRMVKQRRMPSPKTDSGSEVTHSVYLDTMDKRKGSCVFKSTTRGGGGRVVNSIISL
jgi:hypothetical protein